VRLCDGGTDLLRGADAKQGAQTAQEKGGGEETGGGKESKSRGEKACGKKTGGEEAGGEETCSCEKSKKIIRGRNPPDESDLRTRFPSDVKVRPDFMRRYEKGGLSAAGRDGVVLIASQAGKRKRLVRDVWIFYRPRRLPGAVAHQKRLPALLQIPAAIKSSF